MSKFVKLLTSSNAALFRTLSMNKCATLFRSSNVQQFRSNNVALSMSKFAILSMSSNVIQ